MDRNEMMEIIASRHKVTKTKARQIIEATLEAIAEGVATDGVVHIREFGSFSGRKKKARAGRNPKTGEPWEISARTVPRFKASAKLKALVNK